MNQKNTVENTSTKSCRELLEQINAYSGHFPFQPIRELQNRKEEAIPALLNILEEVIKSPNRFLDGSMSHIYSLFLLAGFREKKAYPLIISFLKLPPETSYDLLGDTFTEGLPSIIASVYDGNPDPIIELMLSNPDDTFKSVMASCLSTIVYNKKLSKEVLSSKISEWVEIAKLKQDLALGTAIVYLVYKTGLTDKKNLVLELFDDDLVITEVIGKRTFLAGLDNHRPSNTEHKKLVNDAIKEMSWWYCFEMNSYSISRSDQCPCRSGKTHKECCAPIKNKYVNK